jgi:hypothetical protein
MVSKNIAANPVSASNIQQRSNLHKLGAGRGRVKGGRERVTSRGTNQYGTPRL